MYHDAHQRRPDLLGFESSHYKTIESQSDEVVPNLQRDRNQTDQVYSRWLKLSSIYQSLEFIVETRIFAEMKIKNQGTKYFQWGKKSTSILFFYEN